MSDVIVENIKQTTENITDSQMFANNMAEQLQMAGRVQRDFLPKQMPNSDSLHWAVTFLPAQCVSGDIYDIARIDEQHIGFYIADVVGHGIPAALLTIFIKQALVMRQTTEKSYTIFSPAQVIKNLNHRITSQKLSGNQFVTCCYCLLNTQTLQLTYVRAGHPYPVLIRKGCGPEQLQAQGTLLGIFDNADFVQQTIKLIPGDKLLLYSDGAEPLIGKFDEKKGFNFSSQFCRITDKPIEEMTDELNTIFKAWKPKPAELDDITTVGFEIL